MNYLTKMKNTKIEIVQIKSAIGYNVKTKKTLEALGIKKMNQKVIKNDGVAIRGMIDKVKHLIKFEEVK
jgi:large subunit ribosomal protein L30|tara:strand:- start:84 stop:290 length:207 start_codon:yes stop_codon:yes gene_type:complete